MGDYFNRLGSRSFIHKKITSLPYALEQPIAYTANKEDDFMGILTKRISILTLLSLIAVLQLIWLFSFNHTFSEVILLLIVSSLFILFSGLFSIDNITDKQSFNFRMRIGFVLELLAFILLI